MSDVIFYTYSSIVGTRRHRVEKRHSEMYQFDLLEALRIGLLEEVWRVCSDGKAYRLDYYLNGVYHT